MGGGDKCHLCTVSTRNCRPEMESVRFRRQLLEEAKHMEARIEGSAGHFPPKMNKGTYSCRQLWWREWVGA